MASNVVAEPTPADSNKWAGGLLAAGCFLVVAAIIVHLASGAPRMMGASAETIASVLVEGEAGFTIVGFLSIPANLAVIVAAFMLATNRNNPRPGVPAAALWYTVGVGYLLALLYDVALPYLLVPLAGSYAANPILFAGLYDTFDMIHSAGLLFAFLAVAELFRQEMSRREPALPKAWAAGAAIAAVLGAVLMASFLLDWNLVFLGPAALVTWASLGVAGFRMARGQARPALPTSRPSDA